MPAMGTTPGPGHADTAEEQVTRARMIAALGRAWTFLDSELVPLFELSEDTDDAILEEQIDLALGELRPLVDSRQGAEAVDIVRTAYELADVARLIRRSAADRRADGLSSVQRALADLRAIGTAELMLRRCTQVVCERCGFDRAILFRVEDDSVFPAGAFDRRDRDYDGKVKHFAEKVGRAVLGDMLLETDMLRRRVPGIVHDAQHDPRTFKPLVSLSGVRSYVAAPIAPQGRVIGFLHADVHYQRREVDIVDRDVLWAFAEGCGYALERTLLRDQVRQQRERIRELLHTADELVIEIGESELALERVERDATQRANTALPTGGSRIHALLTPREIEVMELLVHGATNKQIAERFVLAEATVKSHVTHVYRKLHAGNRAEAVQRYMRLLSQDHQ